MLDTTICSEWNGYLGGMWNVLELRNNTPGNKSTLTTVYDAGGNAQGSAAATVVANTSYDILVNAVSGWNLNSYGKVCTNINAGNPGDVDGTKVHYLPAGNSFAFGFAMPFSNGLTGSQFVQYDTMQPSANFLDASNPVLNWLQLTNLGSTQQAGTLDLYDQQGTAIESVRLLLNADSRIDFGVHERAPSAVGIAEWRPDSSVVPFELRIIRYFRDNAIGVDSYAGALQTAGARGSGREVYLPLDASSGPAVIEVSNTKNSDSFVIVSVFNQTGTNVGQGSFTLPPYATQHVVTNQMLANGVGYATVKGIGVGTVITGAVNYGWSENGSLDFAYAVRAEEPLGSELRGNYNTFIGQQCELTLINTDSADQDVTLNMTRYDGSIVLSGEQVTVPARNAVTRDICANDPTDAYGVVVVQPQTANSIIGHLLRIGADNAYRFSTPVRP